MSHGERSESMWEDSRHGTIVDIVLTIDVGMALHKYIYIYILPDVLTEEAPWSVFVAEPCGPTGAVSVLVPLTQHTLFNGTVRAADEDSVGLTAFEWSDLSVEKSHTRPHDKREKSEKDNALRW